jgi:hypothetical protein
MAREDPKSAARSLGIWTPKWSQLVLAASGLVAWLIAIGLTLLSKGEAVATAFVMAGILLIGAAAFYSRVRKLTKEGVEIDPLERIRGLEVNLPPPAADASALEERRNVIEAVEAAISLPRGRSTRNRLITS